MTVLRVRFALAAVFLRYGVAGNAKLKLSTMDYQLSANVTAADAESDEALVLPLEELLPWGSPLPEVLAMAGLYRSA